ncbi:hypothetical protein P280DRAFT_544573 [Massarina eburnea CBS 473.64]|uniref:SRP9 domain-containing protein n=1 Tax=Massarina eburnea CBS 473.64 TaxID=1395130 RepID=A0A6A6SIF7_9PLEO|nr:hypothetical protein P280DRAFT_544573 [Massarina eburnea CBS 473.64]
MPYFKTSTEWFDQSSLLLKARPTTTRITSKYTVLKPSASKIKKRQKYLEKKAARPAKAEEAPRTSSPPPAAPAQDPEEPTATFTLKTFDPDSGTCLQYETAKAAEVGRLIGSLGRLGRHMAALPEVAEDLSAGADVAATGTSTPKVEEDAKMGGVPAEQKTGGGKKKKKGKK